MKKRIGFMAALLFVLLFVTACGETEFVSDEKFDYERKSGQAGYSVTSYQWDGDTSNMDIYIPDTYNGKTVTALGSEPRTPFTIMFPEGFIDNSDDSWFTCSGSDEGNEFSDDYTVFHFVIHVGKYVNSSFLVGPDYYGRREDNVDRIYYKIEYEWQVDPENPYFTSEDFGL